MKAFSKILSSVRIIHDLNTNWEINNGFPSSLLSSLTLSQCIGET